MIQLRKRKLPRAHLSTSGSDQQGPSNNASEHGTKESCIVPSLQQSSQQVLGSFNDESVVVTRKKGRKPKIRIPFECVADEINGKQIGLKKEIGKSVVLPAGDLSSDNDLCMQRPPRKRGRKPKCVGLTCCGQISCNSDATVSHEQKLLKKRGRKPKCQKSESESIKTREKKKSATAVVEKKSDLRIKSGRQRKLSVSNLSLTLNDVGCSDSIVSPKQVDIKKKGRKPVSRIECEVSQSCVSDAIPESGSGKQEQVLGCSSDVKEPGKRGRKPGSVNKKTLMRLKQTTRQTSSIRNVSNNIKNPLPEHSMNHHTEEESATTQIPCLKMELRNSRKTRSAPTLQVPYSLEKNDPSPMQICDPSCKLNDKGKSTDHKISKNMVNKCSSKTCCTNSRGLPNPIVRLENCENLHKQYCTDMETAVESMSAAKNLNMQNQVSSDNIVTANNASLSALDDAEISEVFESTSNRKKSSPIQRLVRVKRKFKKEAQKINSFIGRGDGCSSRSESRTMKVRNEVPQCIEEPPDNVRWLCLNTGVLLKETNNNTIKSGNLKEMDELFDHKRTIEGPHACSSLGSWRTQALIASEEEISDRDSVDKQWSMSPSIADYSNISQSVEKVKVSCQRIIPFSGKSVWKCSCARTCVWDFPRKGATDSTEILGIKAERSLEVYSNYMSPLFESISAGSIQERTEDINNSEVLDKKIKLCSENTPHSFSTNVCSLVKSHCSEKKEISDILFSTGEANDIIVTPVPLPSEDKSKEVNLAASLDFESNDLQNTTIQSSNPQKDDENHPIFKSPEKSVTILKLSPISNTVLKIPLKLGTEEGLNHNSVSLFDVIETSDLHQVSIPVVTKHLPNEMSSAVTVLHKADTGVREYSPECSTWKTLQMNNEVFQSQLHKSHNHNKNHTSFDFEDGMSFKTSSYSECLDKDVSLKHAVMSDSTVTPMPISNQCPLVNNSTPDILNAFEDDILILDVIPDDPDLFDFSSEEEIDFSNSCVSNSRSNASTSKPKIMPLICKIPTKEPSPDNKSKTHSQRIEHSFESCIDAANDYQAAIKDKHIASNSLPEACAEEVELLPELEEFGDSPEQLNKSDHQETGHSEKSEGGESSTFREILPSMRASRRYRPFLHPLNAESTLKDYQHSRKDLPPLDTMNIDSREKRKTEFSFSNPKIQITWLPYGYCKFFFNTLYGCRSKQCSFIHVPKQCDEKLCMDLLRKLLNENQALLLTRAVWIFTEYYGQHLPREHYERSILSALLNPLLNLSWWKDAFHLLETAATAKILPSVDLLIKVFERVSSTGLETFMSHLLDIFCKFLDLGLNFTSVEINQIIATINPFTASAGHINMLVSIKSRFDVKPSKQNWTQDLDTAIAEVEHCKVNSNWMKLGTLYLDVCRGCENITDLKNFSRRIAEALMKDSDEERSEIPYCEFADTIVKNPQLNDILKNILGRIGISVMSFYHRKGLWQKGRKVLNKLKELQINYTVLKGLAGQESVSSRCHVINIAVEIFLMCGNLISAFKVLKESDWIINTTTWPCERMDVLKRHNLLCALVQETLSKNMFTMCFDILQNLPGFQESQADVTVSQYHVLFNKVLSSCIENRSLGISSSIVEFMVTNKIPVEYIYLQQLITTLGHSGLWPKARKHYKNALSFGFYPLFEGNKDHKILYIPSFMSEVEMLITVECFMVINASIIQSPGGSNQSLQIVLKKMEADKSQGKDSYQTATERLLEASRLSNPRLFIKHTTVNNANEQVYILDQNSSLKWLNENLKWAGNIWSNH